jgi:lysozyme
VVVVQAGRDAGGGWMVENARMKLPTVLILVVTLAAGAHVPGAGEAQQALPVPVGIDVSHHSGAIDWKTVAAQGPAFVYLKATEGIDDADPSFAEHWRQLGELGIPRGAYHFYVTEDDPEQQARFFLSVARPGKGDLPPVVDVETLGHGTTGPLAPGLRRYLELIERETGRIPVIYTGPRFWDTHFDASFARYQLWVAEYGVAEPTLPAGWTEWLFWQFQGDAAIPGVEKTADRSRLRGSVPLQSLLLVPESASER